MTSNGRGELATQPGCGLQAAARQANAPRQFSCTADNLSREHWAAHWVDKGRV